MADENNEAAPTPTPSRSTTPSDLDDRLEPLEEFRNRAEGWMKEVTAQVARLAASTEQEEKRRQTLEDRLADIEERIRSLLTLTEMISLGKNPFASQEPSGNRAVQSSPPANPYGTNDPFAGSSAPSHPSSDPARAERTAPDDAAAEIHTDPKDGSSLAAGALSGTEAPSASVGQPRQPEDLQAEEQAAASATPGASGERTDDGQETEQAPASEQDATEDRDRDQDEPRSERPGFHPNDAHAEGEVPVPGDPAGDHAEATAASGVPERGDPVSNGTTARRLLVVAWADLLAPAAATIDLERFTGFYVDAQWVDEETARLVLRLVHEMDDHVEPADCDLRALHEATIRLLGEHDPEVTRFTRVDDPGHDEPSASDSGENVADAEQETPDHVNAT